MDEIIPAKVLGVSRGAGDQEKGAESLADAPLLCLLVAASDRPCSSQPGKARAFSGELL